MAFGYSVWDASGALQATSEGTALGRYIGSTYISGTVGSGTISVPAFTGQKPWYQFQFNPNLNGLTPQATISGTTISWSFRPEEHTSELQSRMSISYALFCLKKKNSLSEHPQTIIITTD